jgi:hypothetical protein
MALDVTGPMTRSSG